jgi:hypothetical protein
MDQLFKLSIVGLIFLIFNGCRSVKPHPAAVAIPAIHHFDSFYFQFHTDSVFQLSRTVFPLEGKPEQLDTTSYADTYFWPKETWILHHLPDVRDTTYDQVFQVIDSTLLREIIFHNPSGYSMERRFSYMDEGWHLIYYAPMRKPIRIEIN